MNQRELAQQIREDRAADRALDRYYARRDLEAERFARGQEAREQRLWQANRPQKTKRQTQAQQELRQFLNALAFAPVALFSWGFFLWRRITGHHDEMPMHWYDR